MIVEVGLVDGETVGVIVGYTEDWMVVTQGWEDGIRVTVAVGIRFVAFCNCNTINPRQ